MTGHALVQALSFADFSVQSELNFLDELFTPFFCHVVFETNGLLIHRYVH